tara:strand:- start:170 stop:1381 length:1212 start_codon:yes stop_codon:yes gene_type:complete
MNGLKIRDDIVNNNKKHMIGGGVISEGGYGCVFHPKISCSGKETSNTDYISKIQKDNFYSDNELYISSIIKNIPNYENFFSVVLSSCKVSLSKISSNYISECKTTLQGIKTAVLFNLKYINNKNLHSILTSKKLLDNYVAEDVYSAKHTIFIIINTFKMILGIINKLSHYQIIHFDIKPDNILYDIDRNIPIIIDFGISIHKDKLDPSTYKKHFYVFYPEYYIWCLDIHYICYLLHVNSSPKEDEIEEICDMFINSNRVLKMFSPDFIKQYRDWCIKSFVRWVGEDHITVIQKLLEHSDKWDLYSISIIYLNIIHYWGISGFDNNMFMIEFTKLLLQNIHPYPEKRYTINDTISNFDSFFYSNTDENNINGIINSVQENFDSIKDSIKHEKTLLNKLKQHITL